MAKALIPLANGFEEIEAVTIADVLRRGGVDVVIASVGESEMVTGAHGMAVRADMPFEQVASETFEAIVLPGGSQGAENLGNSDALIRKLREQHASGGLICAICAAPLVLVEAGVLDAGVQVTCYPTCQMELDREWTPAPVVHDRNVITGQAPGSALLFSLVVLQALVGTSAASKVARGMVTDVLN